GRRCRGRAHGGRYARGRGAGRGGRHARRAARRVLAGRRRAAHGDRAARRAGAVDGARHRPSPRPVPGWKVNPPDVDAVRGSMAVQTDPDTAVATGAAARFAELMDGYLGTQLLYVAAELDLMDALRGAPRSAAEVAEEVGAHA